MFHNPLEYACVRFGGVVLAFTRKYELDDSEWQDIVDRSESLPFKSMPETEEYYSKPPSDLQDKHKVVLDKHRSPDSEMRILVISRDRSSCRYCGIGLTDDSKIDIDHVFPHSRGGMTVVDNLVTACRKCNRKKHNKTPEEVGFTLLAIS